MTDDNNCERSSGIQCSIKVTFVGDSGSGKTSLIMSLIKGCHVMTDQPTQDITEYTWEPFQSNSPNFSDINNSHFDKTLTIHDTSGRGVVQKLCSLLYSKYSVFVVVFDISNTTSCNNVAAIITRIQSRARYADIMLVATHADTVTEEESAKRIDDVLRSLASHENEWKKALKHCLDECRHCSKEDGWCRQRKAHLEEQNAKRAKTPEKVWLVSCKEGKGLSSFTSTLLESTLQAVNHFCCNTNINHLYSTIVDLRNAGQIICDLNDLNVIDERSTKSAKDLEDKLRQELSTLDMLGHIQLLMKSSTDKDNNIYSYHVCICPVLFIKAVCSLHFDFDTSFEIECRRFWPTEYGYKPPELSELAKMFEEVPNKGRVREVLLPLLWKDLYLVESELIKLRDVMIDLGILLPTEIENNPAPDLLLVLPCYPSFGSTVAYSLPAMDLIPDIRPALHWSPFPLPGDIQLVWRYTFPCGLPSDLFGLALARCQTVLSDSWYRHIWNGGLLTVGHEMTLHVRKQEECISVYCRYVVDEDQSVTEEVKHMWIHVAHFVTRINSLISEYHGLLYCISLSLSVLGSSGESVPREEFFPLPECILSGLQSDIYRYSAGDEEEIMRASHILPFQVPGNCCTVDSLLQLILSEEILICKNCDAQLESTCHENELRSSDYRRSHNKKTHRVVRWNLEDIQFNGETLNANGDRPDGDLRGTGYSTAEDYKTMVTWHTATIFVADVMATAVANYIQIAYDDRSNNQITYSQVQATHLAASAIHATQHGDTDGAARRIMKIAASNSTDLTREEKKGQVCQLQSKMCIVL